MNTLVGTGPDMSSMPGQAPSSQAPGPNTGNHMAPPWPQQPHNQPAPQPPQNSNMPGSVMGQQTGPSQANNIPRPIGPGNGIPPQPNPSSVGLGPNSMPRSSSISGSDMQKAYDALGLEHFHSNSVPNGPGIGGEYSCSFS